MITKKDVSVEIHIHDGLTLSCIKDNRRVAIRYIGYTKQTAMKKFLERVNDEGILCD